eukprot:1188572-Prorocentrum_minimum.AAC.2
MTEDRLFPREWQMRSGKLITSRATGRAAGISTPCLSLVDDLRVRHGVDIPAAISVALPVMSLQDRYRQLVLNSPGGGAVKWAHRENREAESRGARNRTMALPKKEKKGRRQVVDRKTISTPLTTPVYSEADGR